MSTNKNQILVQAGGSGEDKVGSTKPKIILKKDKVKIQLQKEKERAREKSYSFEERLKGYAFRKIGKVNKRVDLVASKEAFMSAEEVYELFPDLSYDLVMLVWWTFHGPTTGIPIAFIKRFEPHYQKLSQNQRKNFDPEFTA